MLNKNNKLLPLCRNCPFEERIKNQRHFFILINYKFISQLISNIYLIETENLSNISRAKKILSINQTIDVIPNQLAQLMIKFYLTNAY